jgi:hypothetical protein
MVVCSLPPPRRERCTYGACADRIQLIVVGRPAARVATGAYHAAAGEKCILSAERLPSGLDDRPDAAQRRNRLLLTRKVRDPLLVHE